LNEKKRFIEDQNSKKLIVKHINSQHKNHNRYTKEELEQMIQCKDVPDILKNTSKELFLKGWNLSEIYPILMTKHPNLEYLFSIF